MNSFNWYRDKDRDMNSFNWYEEYKMGFESKDMWYGFEKIWRMSVVECCWV